MAAAISRMQFLRGDFSGKDAPLRPPWALPENEFSDRCDRCGDCIKHCPTHIIKSGQGSYPIVDFAAGECLFCADCVGACKPQALYISNKAQPWTLRATINSEQCLAFQNVECRSCYDPCAAQAIKITPRIGGVSIPLLNETSCTGCGACFSVCPTQAISIHSKPAQVAI